MLVSAVVPMVLDVGAAIAMNVVLGTDFPPDVLELGWSATWWAMPTHASVPKGRGFPSGESRRTSQATATAPVHVARSG